MKVAPLPLALWSGTRKCSYRPRSTQKIQRHKKVTQKWLSGPRPKWLKVTYKWLKSDFLGGSKVTFESLLSKFWVTLVGAPRATFESLFFYVCIFRGFGVCRKHFQVTIPVSLSAENTENADTQTRKMREMQLTGFLATGLRWPPNFATEPWQPRIRQLTAAQTPPLFDQQATKQDPSPKKNLMMPLTTWNQTRPGVQMRL